MAKEQATEPKTYYSEITGLSISAVKGELTQIAGERVRVGEKIIQFAPMGSSNFGSFTTTDPELIAFLEHRVRTVGDVFGPEEYYRRIVPTEQQIKDLKSRLIETENRLAEVLKQQGKLPKA